MKASYYDTEIVHIIEENDFVRRFFFRTPHQNSFDFKPGQFVMIDLPIESKITNRSYSIASAPDGTNIFELIIVLNPSGKGTPHMWEHFHVGDVVKVAGPLGKFVLPEQIEQDLCFVATGTGIAPLRSMALDLINRNVPRKNIYMIFGNRKIKDILYRKEMEELEAAHPEFHFLPVLSREEPHLWDGKQGYVHPIYQDLFADKRPGMFYLCGWKNMIMEARDNLTQMGYGKEHIKFELYD